MVKYKNVTQVVNSLNSSSLEYNTVQLVNITKMVILVAMLIISASNYSFIYPYTFMSSKHMSCPLWIWKPHIYNSSHRLFPQKVSLTLHTFFTSYIVLSYSNTTHILTRVHSNTVRIFYELVNYLYIHTIHSNVYSQLVFGEAYTDFSVYSLFRCSHYNK